jgi:hypothetical protein
MSSEHASTSASSCSDAAPSHSPIKPRLIWRGSLHLQDGTALPGIAFISNVQPCFSSQPPQSDSKQDAASASKPPLSLSKEQQDALSLSIEMVRHAPINIVEVVEGADRDDQGSLLKPKRIISSNPRENSDHIKVSYQAGGGIRMYVDPAFPSTVAYMERIFCYDDENDEEDIEAFSSSKRQQRVERDTAAGSANNVIVLSLDKSFRYSLDRTTTDQEDDVFSEDARSAWKDTLKSTSSGSIEAVLLGVKVREEDGSTRLEMHVGQKVVSKVVPRESSSSSNSGNGLFSYETIESFGVRPDDPAPRGLSRVLSAKYRSTPSLLSQRHSTSSSSFAAPAPPLPPAHRASSTTSLKRPPLSSTADGDARASSMPVLKRESSLQSEIFKKRLKVDQEGNDDTKIQEHNRSLIKKLVHHQLLGKGVEKSDQEYLACFGPTCNGTVLAFRRVIKTEVIDKSQAAIIVNKHLDMYL